MRYRILFVMHMPPPVYGASMMGKYIRDSKLVNESFECHYMNLAVADTLQNIGRGGIGKFWAVCKKLVSVIKTVRRIKPEYVYITPNSAGIPFYKDFITVMILKLMQQHVVMHFHNKGVASHQHRWLDDKLYRLYFRNTKLILLAEALYEDVKRYVRREDIFVCPNAIPDVAEERLSCCHDIMECGWKNNGEEDRVAHILWLNNIMITKGVMEYLSALKMLRSKGLIFHADFIGGVTREISIDEFMTAVSMMGLNECVTYVGPKYGEEKIAYYRGADIFVLPSYTEALPVSVLEAMQFGLPVVASNVGGVCEEVVDTVNGFLLGGETPVMDNSFRPDPKELAEKLEILLCDGELRGRMGRESRDRFERMFVLEIFEKRFVEVIRGCINSEKGR